MQKQMCQVLVPQYMKSFSCICGRCEDNCCAGWQINVDRKNYKKYQKLRGMEIKQLLDKFIVRNRSASSEREYAKIPLVEKGICPFLTDQNLCGIQLQLGEDYLPVTCASYPRVVNIVNGVLEKSAHVSCPEAARVALLNPGGIEFDQYEELSGVNDVKGVLNTNSTKLSGQPEKYFWELRVFTIQVLQNRDFRLWERLVILGMFYNKVQDKVNDGLANGIPDYIASYTNMIEKGLFGEILQEIPSKSGIQMEMLKEIMDQRIMSGIVHVRYLECLKEFLYGIEYVGNEYVADISERYAEGYLNYYEPFMYKHEYILENYLVNYVFKNFFPFNNMERSMFENYMILVLHYSLIKMHLIGIARYNKGLNVEMAIKLISSFARIVEHSPGYLRQMLAWARQHDYITMAYMAILIKN